MDFFYFPKHLNLRCNTLLVIGFLLRNKVGGSHGNGRYIHIRFQVHMYVTKAHIGGVGVHVVAFVVSLTAFIWLQQ